MITDIKPIKSDRAQIKLLLKAHFINYMPLWVVAFRYKSNYIIHFTGTAFSFLSKSILQFGRVLSFFGFFSALLQCL